MYKVSRAKGFAPIPNWLIQDSEAGVYEIAVYAALSSHSGHGGIWPSQSTIAKHARCSERQVRNSLIKLRELGVVTWTKRPSARGVQNVYLLHSEGRIVESIPEEPPAHHAAPTSTPFRTPPAHHAVEEEPIEEEPFKKIVVGKPPTIGSANSGSLCILLADLIEKNGSKRPTITEKWRDACRLLIDSDNRTPDDVDKIIRWSQQDEFWRGNIESMPTLRRQYDRLRLASERAKYPIGRNPATAVQSGQSLVSRLESQHQMIEGSTS